MASKRSAFGRVFKRSGRPGYYVRVRIRDKEVVRWAGPDRRTAAEFLAELLRKTAREELLGEKSIESASFAQLEKILLEHFRARHAPNNYAIEVSRMKKIVAWFGGTMLRDITQGDIQDFLTDLRLEGGLSISTVNRYTSQLSVSFKVAIAKGFARTNPVTGIPRPREEERPVPFISSGDVQRLVAEARDWRFGTLLRILADTGLRRSEALALTWRDVNTVRRTILVRRSKTRKPRYVDLTDAVVATFERLREEHTVPLKGPDLVWPEWKDKLPQAVSSRFKTVASRAGMGELRLHDLRHGFCSRLAQANTPLPTIGALAGHKSWQTTDRYASHLPEGATRAAIRALDAHERQAESAAETESGKDREAAS